MIKISYTLDSVEMEPGPNLYCMGKPEDYRRLLNDLHGLGKNDGVRIDIGGLDYVKLPEGYTFLAESSPDGETLCSVQGASIKMVLDRMVWTEVLHLILSISFSPSHNFVEFDDRDLREDANIIISSEW